MNRWAEPYVSELRAGRRVSFRPKGRSMEPRIMSGQLVTVEPVNPDHEVFKGDVVLCSVQGRHFLHVVKEVKWDGTSVMFLIGNLRGGTNGWVRGGEVYGRLVEGGSRG